MCGGNRRWRGAGVGPKRKFIQLRKENYPKTRHRSRKRQRQRVATSRDDYLELNKAHTRRI